MPIAYQFRAFIILRWFSNQENAILVLSDNLITFSVILKATSQDFTLSNRPLSFKYMFEDVRDRNSSNRLRPITRSRQGKVGVSVNSCDVMHETASPLVKVKFPQIVEGLGKSQAAQSRKVNNYKDLYGNLDNKLKKIFTSKSFQ